MPKNMVSKGKLGAKGGIAGNERGMRMDIIYGECTVLYIWRCKKNEGKAPAPPLMANTAPCPSLFLSLSQNANDEVGLSNAP